MPRNQNLNRSAGIARLGSRFIGGGGPCRQRQELREVGVGVPRMTGHDQTVHRIRESNSRRLNMSLFDVNPQIKARPLNVHLLPFLCERHGFKQASRQKQCSQGRFAWPQGGLRFVFLSDRSENFLHQRWLPCIVPLI